MNDDVFGNEVLKMSQQVPSVNKRICMCTCLCVYSFSLKYFIFSSIFCPSLKLLKGYDSFFQFVPLQCHPSLREKWQLLSVQLFKSNVISLVALHQKSFGPEMVWTSLNSTMASFQSFTLPTNLTLTTVNIVLKQFYSSRGSDQGTKEDMLVWRIMAVEGRPPASKWLLIVSQTLKLWKWLLRNWQPYDDLFLWSLISMVQFMNLLTTFTWKLNLLTCETITPFVLTPKSCLQGQIPLIMHVLCITFDCDCTKAILFISDPPKFLSPLKNYTVKELASDITFSCTVNAKPNIGLSYRWFFNGRETSKTTQDFVVKIAKKENTGSYMCQASNTVGSTNSTIGTLLVTCTYILNHFVWTATFVLAFSNYKMETSTPFHVLILNIRSAILFSTILINGLLF